MRIIPGCDALQARAAASTCSEQQDRHDIGKKQIQESSIFVQASMFHDEKRQAITESSFHSTGTRQSVRHKGPGQPRLHLGIRERLPSLLRILVD